MPPDAQPDVNAPLPFFTTEIAALSAAPTVLEPVPAAPAPPFSVEADRHADASPFDAPTTAEPAPPRPTIDDAIAAHLAQAHAIIDKNLANANVLSQLSPTVKILMPLIASTLHELLAHITSNPSDTLVKDLAVGADAAIDAVAADVAKT